MPGLSSRGIFICYRREDAAPYARLLQFQLSERFPDTRVFIDLDSIEVGQDFAEVIEAAVDSCAVLVALIGRQWVTLTGEDGRSRIDDPDDFVRFEVQAALERGVRVVPVLVDGAKPLRRQQLPAELHKLARLNALELSYGRYQYDADRLLDFIQQVLDAAPSTIQQVASTADAATSIAPDADDVRPGANAGGGPTDDPGSQSPALGHRRPAGDARWAVRGEAKSQQPGEYGMTAVNPFTGYGAIASGERFVGRDLERGTLQRRLYEAHSSAALIGLPRMGKSSLANQILTEAPAEGTLTGWINLATVRSGAEALRDILGLCPSETVLRATFTTGGSANDAPEISIHDLYRKIRDALLRLGRSGGSLVVVLDEFDSIAHFPDAREFLNLLRELACYPDRIPMAVLAVAHRAVEHIEVDVAGVSNFAAVCDSMYLGPMGYEEIRAMAARSATLPGDAPDVAWRYAAGQPFLSEVTFCRVLEHGTIDVGRIIQPDLTFYYTELERFLRREELWEPLLQLASGSAAEVNAEYGALVRRYGLIDENGELWSSAFSTYLRSRS